MGEIVPVHVEGLDHVVLRVADVDRSLGFWSGLLGLATVREDEWRAGTAAFVSVRIDATTIVDLVAGERSGENVDHVCLTLAPVDLEALATSGSFQIVSGPARLFGAQGEGWGLYVRDPDGNLVELRHYGDSVNG